MAYCCYNFIGNQRNDMEQVLIQRRGSYLYAQAWRKIVVWITVIYLLTGMALAFVADRKFDNLAVTGTVIGVTLSFIVAIWVVYLGVLWFFAREARQSVDIGDEGIREMHNGRERAFIPWDGIKEIEVAATLPAGASLRVKSSFSEIAFSNVDLVVTEPISLREMHASLSKTDQLRRLLELLSEGAPQANVNLNTLAKRRMRNGS